METNVRFLKKYYPKEYRAAIDKIERTYINRRKPIEELLCLIDELEEENKVLRERLSKFESPTIIINGPVPPQPPLLRLLKESPFPTKICSCCGSTAVRKYLVVGPFNCINSKCKNFGDHPKEPFYG